MEYLLFKFKYEDCTNKDTIPDFQDRIPPELALELLVGSNMKSNIIIDLFPYLGLWQLIIYKLS